MIKTGNDWETVMREECEKEYFSALTEKVRAEYKTRVVYPPASTVLRALSLCSFSSVKVVILGQDPYHGPGQAHGLAFSVPDGVPLPPSLVNIYQEIASEFGVKPPESGDLSNWAKQGVLLLNSSLTVRRAAAGSHSEIGWQFFTDAVIGALNNRPDPIVFLLWGNHAGAKAKLITQSRHLVLTAPHPSPLSAYRGFFGCGHFRRANEFLTANGKEEIRWI